MTGAAVPAGARLIGVGRQADVLDAGQGRVLRRYRDPSRDAVPEAELMRYLREAGVPVPEVYDAQGPDLLMQRLDGPTMLADLGRRPWLVARHATTLAGLHAAVHRVDAPDWLHRPLGVGGVVLHLDLHPDNVILTRDGPVVIDWEAAAAGPAWADPALASVVMSTAPVPGSPTQRFVATAGRALFVRLFTAACDPGPSAEELEQAMRWRLADPSLLPQERDQLQRLLDRRTRTAAGVTATESR